MMAENEEGKVVGVVDLVSFDPANRRAEVGIIIMNEYRRQGYATAVIDAIKDYSLRILHLHQIYAYVDCNNNASMGLFEKAGFCENAKIKDWLFDGVKYHDSVLFLYRF